MKKKFKPSRNVYLYQIWRGKELLLNKNGLRDQIFENIGSSRNLWQLDLTYSIKILENHHSGPFQDVYFFWGAIKLRNQFVFQKLCSLFKVTYLSAFVQRVFKNSHTCVSHRIQKMQCQCYHSNNVTWCSWQFVLAIALF